MTPFVIYCCAGTGGLFLTTVFAQLSNLDVRARFHKTGHAHDMGRGNWQGAGKKICFIGNHAYNYRLNCNFYYTHIWLDRIQQENSGTKIVIIDVDESDYRKVTELYVKKAWPDIWNEQEYNKWVGPDWPQYSSTNISDSKIVCDDLINDFVETQTKPWFNKQHEPSIDYRINFRTIMGIDQQDLVDNVCGILQCSANSTVRDYVAQYQTLNKQMYFKDYV